MSEIKPQIPCFVVTSPILRLMHSECCCSFYILHPILKLPDRGQIVFSSTGEGAHGGLLGEYTYDSVNNRYVQSNSEISHEEYEPKYLFRNEEHEDWLIGSEHDEEGWLWNRNPSQEVPESDWEIFDGEEWNVDPDLKVSKGALKPELESLALDLSYKLTPKMWNGHPIYQNGDGSVLHMASDGYWSVSDRLGEHSIRGLPGRLCPSESDTWEYWDG